MAAPPAVSFGSAWRFWLKLGCVSFGGPAGQIALMHQELVERRRWISEQSFLHALNFCMLLPGPEAQQLATYIGWLLHRTWGGVVAGVLFVLPSLILLIALSWLYMAFGQLPVVAGLFYGIKPAVTAIVLQAAWRIGGRTLRNPVLWSIGAASLMATLAFNAPFPLIVAGAALIGFIGGRVMPVSFSVAGNHGVAESPDPAAPVRLGWLRLLRVAALGVVLWSTPMLLLMATQGWRGTLTQMGWFFTKAALLTFGGAYAVLPYVYQGAVSHYGWLSATQMIDGLALGETTPGPLIMVVTFVGFAGAWGQALFGAQHRFLAGLAAALVVTWFTFLPSVLFIFAGGPLVEATRGNLRFTAPLTAITAAVVGVIVNLALFFGYHVFWPAGLSRQPDWPSLLLALAATVAMLRYRRSVIEVILACAVSGLVARTWLPL